MFKLCWKAFAPQGKPYRIGLLFIHKNGCGGVMSVTERSYGSVPISNVESPVERGEGVLPYTGYIGIFRCEGYSFQAVDSGIGYINQRVWV